MHRALATVALSFVLLSPDTHASAAVCQTATGLVSGLRDRFIARPYRKPAYRFRAYQVWGGGRNFVTVVDTDGDFENGSWWNENDVEERLTNVLNEYYQTQPDTAQFVVLFSSFQVGFPGAFYLPLANDVKGIGYAHSLFGGRETFDSTPDSPLEGLLLMNDYTIWGGIDGLSLVFNQELGHRWGSFVYFREEGQTLDSDLLLGRDQSHWSFFFNSLASPMEGNLWIENEDGTFTSRSEAAEYGYHPLDLYLMGLIGPEEVGEFWFIDNPDLSALGSRGSRITRETSPAYFRPITIGGTKKALTIDDVIRAEGPRDPSHLTAPRNFKVGFILVVRRGQQTDTTLLSEFEGVVDSVVAGWQRATGDRATIEIVSAGPPPPPQKSLGESCEGIFQCDVAQATACIAPKQANQTKYCARRCSVSNPCPTGFCCAPADLLGEPRYCFPTAINVCPLPPPPPDAGAPPPDAGVQAPQPQPGGGCSTTGGGASGMAAMMLWALAMRIRRRAST